MRILLVVDSHYPTFGGAETQVRLLAQLMRERGHEVRVVAPRRKESMSPEDVVDGIRVTRINYPKVPLLGTLVLMGRFARLLLQERDRTDAVHIHIAHNLVAIAGLVRPWLRCPVLVKISGAWEFHGGMLDNAVTRKPPMSWKKRLMLRIDGFQAISRETERRLLAAEVPQAKIHPIPNAVDLRQFPPIERRAKAPGEPLQVLFSGRFVTVKGVDVLVRAWGELASRQGLELHLIGRGELAEDMQAHVAAHGLQDSVRFLGWRAAVRSALREADLYVQPSLSEGLPNAVLEAMAYGLPIVATRVSGNEDLVVDGLNGYLAEAGDSQSLARALQKALDRRQDFPAMGQASRRLIEERYSAERVIAGLEAFFSPQAKALPAR